MAGINFKARWAYGPSLGKPSYISKNRIMIPYDFFIKTFDTSGNNLLDHFDFKIRIGCCSSLPELGLIAVSEHKVNGNINIFNYYTMTNISTLAQNNNEIYSALQFMGLEFLISLQINKHYEVDLWKWLDSERVHFVSVPLLDSEEPFINITVNPLWWYEVLFQSNSRLILWEIKISDEKYFLNSTDYIFFKDDKGKIDLSSYKESNKQKDFQREVIHPSLTPLTLYCACWLPCNHMLVATCAGFFKVENEVATFKKLKDCIDGVTSMIYTKHGLFIGYKTGFVDIVHLSGSRWHVLESANVKQPVNDIFVSPNYSMVTVSSVNGSILISDITQGFGSFKIIFRSDVRGDAGVHYIGHLAQYCVAAKKSGLVHILRALDGRIMSTFRLAEEIASVASSHLCCCITIGTTIGFVYFIDATNPQNPRIVHNSTPYGIAVDHLKFDNLGLYLIASAQNEPINIWNGLPSSGFPFLGAKNVSSYVKDIAAFSRIHVMETLLIILAKSGEGSEKDAGNVLIKFKIPGDFGTDPKKYQIDLLGALSDDALCSQKRRLEHPSCNLDLHCNLGTILYSPIVNKIKRYNVWSDFTNMKPINLLSINSINSLRVSLNQHWIAMSNAHGEVSLYSAAPFTLLASSQKKGTSESTYKSFVEFPLSSNSLMFSSENGILVCYEWVDGSFDLLCTPEFIVQCYLQSSHENDHLSAMEEEDKIKAISQIVSNTEIYINLDRIYQEIEAWICVICFKLDGILNIWNPPDESVSHTFILNDDLLMELAKQNHYKLSTYVNEKRNEDDNPVKLNDNSSKVISSINLGLTTENYSKESIAVDTNQLKFLNTELANQKSNTKDHPRTRHTFNQCVKFKSKYDRLYSVKEFIYEICAIKNEFNKCFDIMYDERFIVSNRVNDTHLKAKRLAQSLPSKTERDFWQAITVEESIVNDLAGTNEQVAEISKSSDAINETKSSIESCMKSAQQIQETFDWEIEILLLKKRYCNYKIYKFEVKIYSVMFSSLVEDELSKWKDETEKEIQFCKSLEIDIIKMTREVLTEEKSLKEIFLELQKIERVISSKIENKCNKIHKSPEVHCILKRQPALKLDENSQSPFCHLSSPINISDLESVTNEMQSRKCPKDFDKTEWEKLRNKQIKALKIGIILKNIQNQAIELIDIKQNCCDIVGKLEKSLNVIQNYLKLLSKLTTKFLVNLKYLITTVLSNEDINLTSDTCGDRKHKPSQFSLLNVSNADNPVWNDVDNEVTNLQKIAELLNETEKNFQYLRTLKFDMDIQINKIKSECDDVLKDLKARFDESKQLLVKTKTVSEEVVDGFKKNVFQLLKSRILSESASQGKIKECK